MPRDLIHVADRLFGRPLFIHPQKAEIIAWALRDRFGAAIEIPEPGAGIADTSATNMSRFTGSRRKPDGNWNMVRQQDGVAIIPVIGSLVNRGAWLDSYSGMTSYEGLGAQIRSAAADKDVRAILLDIDSPGGEATGMFNLGAAVRSARQSKPVVAVVDDLAASAAFGIASAADEIVISPTSIVGSIGVVMLHLDRSGEMASKGVRATLIHAGAHKIDGHPFGPLSNEVSADLQRDVMTFYDRFLETVAEGRGQKLTADAARATEARTFIGSEAIRLGLADRVATFDETLKSLSIQRYARPSTARGNTGARAQMEDMIPKADHEKAVKAAREDGFTAGRAEGIAEGKTAGIAEERARAKAILSLDEARGREAQAAALIGTGIDTEGAKAVLTAAPKATSLDARMTEQSHLPLGGPTGTQPAKPASAAWDKHVERLNAR